MTKQCVNKTVNPVDVFFLETIKGQSGFYNEAE